MKLRDRWNRFLCWIGGHHVTIPHRQFNMGDKGGIASTDEWKTCHCGKEASPVTRTRIRLPYEVKQ